VFVIGAQEYPACAEKVAVNGLVDVDAVADECGDEAAMLPPPQAMHTTRPARASTLTPAEFFMSNASVAC
jgi:hypothetical protein